ncbi:MAG: hypothetical protein ACPGJS_12340 [Flammeovirgaceae bacterium]
MKYSKIIILTLIMSLSSLCSFGQSKFYKENGKPIRVIGENTQLVFQKKNSIIIRKTDKSDKNNKFEFFGAGTLAATLLPSIIDLGFKITTNQIERNLKKYTNEFSAANTYLGNPDAIPSFTVTRRFIKKENNKEYKDSTALSFAFTPIPIFTKNDSSFVYVIKEKPTIKYSGAKVKEDYPFNDYTIELKVTFFNEGKKTTQDLSVKSVQLLKIGEPIEHDNARDYFYISDQIPIGKGFRIAEVSVKMVETNVAKVRAERIQELSNTYADDVKEQVKTVVNYIIEDKGDKEGDQE